MAKKKSPVIDFSSTELNQRSIDYLGVTKQPFANEILSDESFFNHQALEKISDNLIHQVQFSDLLLLIEGIHGAGKTSFFRKFIQLEIDNTKTLAIHAEATDTIVQIQQKMSIHLQDLGDANHLEDNLKSLQMFDQTPLAVINDSHVLSDTTLQELLRYQQQLKQEHDVNLKFLWFANAGMSDTLQKISDIQPDQLYTQNLPIFSPKQASAFINHRLRCAGYYGETLLNDSAITQLFKTCNGSPLDIMVQAAPLIDKAITKIQKPSSGFGKKALIATMILSVLAGGGYAAFIFLNQNINNVTDDVFNPEHNTAAQEFAQESAQQPAQTNVIEILENDEIVADVAPVVNNTAINDDAPSENTTDTSVTETSPETLAEAEKVTDVTTRQMPEKDLSTLTTKTLSEDPEPEPTTTKISAQLKSFSPPTKLDSSLLKLKEMGLHDAAWLLQQNPQNWTLQLLGARETRTLLKFAKDNNLSANAAWYKTWLKTKPYYVVIYGNYESRDAARKSVSSLSPKLRALRPWVKSMSSAQQAIK